MKITVEKLGQILYEEFKADGWGTIDPWWFKNPPHVADESLDEGGGLYEVLERVVERLNKRK